MRVGLFIPCFIDMLYPRVGVATVRLLEHLGVEVDYPVEQTCCGQPHFNAGHWPPAAGMAQRFCRVFEGYDAVVSPSGSCTAMVRQHYPSLIGNNPVCSRVFELSEFIVSKLDIDNVGASLEGRAAVHVGCHGLRELGIGPAVHRLLSRVSGLTLLELESDSWCCGFGGTFSVKFPEVSAAMGQRKLEPIVRAQPDFLISTDMSCLMHLEGMMKRQGVRSPTLLHVAEVLAPGGGPS